MQTSETGNKKLFIPHIMTYKILIKYLSNRNNSFLLSELWRPLISYIYQFLLNPAIPLYQLFKKQRPVALDVESLINFICFGQTFPLY